MQKRIGFLGLGAMGKPMATRLIQAGYEVTVLNRKQAICIQKRAICEVQLSC